MKRLEHPIHIAGTVQKGRGLRLRYPTATLSCPSGVPEGVYASRVRVEGAVFEGATSAGAARSVGAEEPTVETHLLHYEGDLYGKEMEVELLAFVREMKTFSSTDELELAMERDIREIEGFFHVPVSDFRKLELLVGKIVEVSRMEGSEKLLKLRVDIGEGERQIIAGIGTSYAPEELAGREIVIVANLEPRKLMGQESQGMLLAADGEQPVLLQPAREVPPGTRIR